jgi:hypothetical protein
MDKALNKILRRNTGVTGEIDVGQGATENYGTKVRELYSIPIIGASSSS